MKRSAAARMAQIREVLATGAMTEVELKVAIGNVSGRLVRWYVNQMVDVMRAPRPTTGQRSVLEYSLTPTRRVPEPTI